VALVSAGIVGAPLALWWWHVDAEAVPFLVASATLQLAYFTLLAAAYRRADLSVVYPLARGLAPVFVLVGSVVLTDASTSTGQVAGVLLVAAGVLLVRGLGRGQGFAFGIAIAVLIATYTVVDKHGVAHASPVTYVWVITLFPGLVYAAALPRRHKLRDALGARAVVAGVASFAAYGLVLAALKLAPAASVAAVRESSVVIATALAAILLKERVTVWRLTGAMLVVGGVALLAR
jgi:drug/metabolite transporter (DMT)-like permease